MKIISRTDHNERLRLARDFIDQHFARPITLKQVSQEAVFSPYHFIRLFRSAYKQTPHQYLMQRRIEQANALLRSGDLSVTEICAAVGFEGLGSFSALFRKSTGLPPSTYREKACPTSQSTAQHTFIPLCHLLAHGISESPESS